MENNKNQNLSAEELQKQLQEALEAQKKLQEQIDALKGENPENTETEKEEIDVEEYLKQKEEKKAEIKKNKTLKEKIKDYSFTIIFFACLVVSPVVVIKGKDFLQDLQRKRFLEKVEVRQNLNGDWSSEDGTKLHIDEDGTTYFIEYNGDTISYIKKGVIHEDMVCFQNTCKENEEETYESGGVDFKSEYTNNGSDSYKDYKEIPDEEFISTSYNYYDFSNKSASTVSILGKDFTK